MYTNAIAAFYTRPYKYISVSLHLAVFIYTSTPSSYTGIIEQPVSMTAFLNTTVTFYCSAFESAMFWVVDGTHSTNSSIVQRGIQTPSNTRMINGDTMARLIVLASASNNNTGIQCGVFTRHQGKILSDEVELKVQGLQAYFLF